MEQPRSVAINSKGNIIVTEGKGCYVSIFSPTGEKIKSFGSNGSSNGQFCLPVGVAVDGEDNILVTDFINDGIQKFTSDGKFISATWLSCPIGIAVLLVLLSILIVKRFMWQTQVITVLTS